MLEQPNSPPEPLLSRGQQVLLVILATLLAGSALTRWTWAYLSGQPLVEIRRLEARQAEFWIDINTAGWVEWMQVPEVGEKLARAIVADRQQRGPFESVDDLTRVKGIGPKTLEKMRPHLRVVNSLVTQ